MSDRACLVPIFSVLQHLSAMATPIGFDIPGNPAASSVGSVDMEGDFVVDCDEMTSRVIKVMKQLCAHYGGPAQYLSTVYPDVAHKKEFYDKLMKNFPVAAEYTSTLPLPTIAPDSWQGGDCLTFHPAQMAFGDKASLKGAPDGRIAIQLCEQYLKDGFVSAGDPIMVLTVDIDDSAELFGPPVKAVGQNVASLTAFPVEYVKGSARTQTLLALLSILLNDDIDIEQAWWMGG